MMNNTTSFESECGSAYLKWTLRLIYSIIFILGLFGNAVVCIAIVKRKGTQTSCNIFTFNLAFHDLILVLVYVPTQMIFFENCYQWVLGSFMCYLAYIILPLSLSVSIGTLLAITADRYRAIVFPVKSRLSRRRVMLIIAVIWVASAVTALPLLFVTKFFSPQPGIKYCAEYWTSPMFQEIYWISMFCIQYLLPLSIIAILAGITAYTLRKNALPVAMETCTQSEVFRKAIQRRAKQTQRIRNMLIALVLLYAICMLPQHVVYTFWSKYGNLTETSYREMANLIANIFPIANSALNAIAYGTLNKEFKDVFNFLFKCTCLKSRYLLRKPSTFETETSVKKNESGPLLHQEWKNGRETMVSPLPKMKIKKNDCTQDSCNRGNNYSADQERLGLIVFTGVGSSRRESLQYISSGDREELPQKETVV